MKLHEHIDRMTDYTRVYEPFMRLSGVGGYRDNARLLSYLLHLHMEQDAEQIELPDEAFRIVEMHPHSFHKSRQALLASKYVRKTGGCYTVDVRRLMPDVQAALDDQ